MSKITFGGGGGGAASATSGANIGAGTQIWLSGIPVGNYLGQGGLSDMNWADPVDSNIVPAGGQSIGSSGNAFNSGVFSGLYLQGPTTTPQSGILLIYSAPQWMLVRNYQNTGYMDIVASEVRGNPYGVGLTGNVIRFRDTGDVHWSSTTSPTGSQDLTISRKEAGMLQIGTSTTNALGHIKASGGIFTSGVVLASPNGSGWNITIDNNGTLSVSGPYVLG